MHENDNFCKNKHLQSRENGAYKSAYKKPKKQAKISLKAPFFWMK
jgi:hypothetical protein